MPLPSRVITVNITAKRIQCRHVEQQGVTLIELMISLALGMLLIISMPQLYLSHKHTSLRQEGIARLSENGRLATELLARLIRRSGDFGCTGARESDLVNHLTMEMQGLHGIEGGLGNQPPVPDQITVRYAETELVSALRDIDDPYNPAVNPDPLSATAMIFVDDGSEIEAGDQIALGDCRRGDIVEVNQVTTSEGISQLSITGCSSCTHHYAAGSEVRKIRQSRLFIRKGIQGEPALYLQVNDNPPQELIEGVENMQITYGEDIDGDGATNRYVTADTIDRKCQSQRNNECWRRVSSVRIALLLRSTSGNGSSLPQSFRFEGKSFNATDKHQRLEYLALISLKHRRF